MSRRRSLLLLAVATAIVAGVASVALAAGSSPWKPTSGKARGPALADARKRLRSFVPPPGSHRVPSLPKSLNLNGPFSTIGSPNFFDVHDLWVSSEPVESVRAYLAGHNPPGAKGSLSGSEGGREGTYRWDYGYDWPELPGVASDREMLVGVVARPGGGSALRVDAQGVWVEPKPETERIPAGVRFLEVVETQGGKTHRARTANAAKIAAVTKLLDGFAIVQRSGPHGCTLIPSDQATLKATFRAAPGGPVLAETEQQLPEASCQDIGLTIEGAEERPLVNRGNALTTSLQSLLAKKYKSPLSDDVGF
jgi:hypothetical protein